MAYYALPAFWTSTLTDGIVPNWIPFQQMGYPMALNLQSGVNYPPFWTFPLLGLSYTLNRAVLFQVCHVLLGSVGMFFFLKASGLKPFYALIGAISFQYFGGFYSNSQHADIVRAFAIVPWLLYLFTFNIDSELTIRQNTKILLIPIAILALATGGYPGNFIAAIFVLMLYSVSQLLSLYLRNRSIGRFLRFGSLVVVLTALGGLISFYHLAPAYFSREYLYRFSTISDLLPGIMGMSFKHLPSLILTNIVTPGEPSMTSFYVGVPILLMVFFTTLNDIKRFFPVFFIGLISFFMAGGPNSLLWMSLRGVTSLFSYSRFPMSDYREFFCVALVFFGVVGFSNLMTYKFTFTSVCLRFVLGVILVAGLVVMVIKNPATGLFSRPIQSSEVGFVLTLTVTGGILIFWAYKTQRKELSILGSILIFLILVSGQTVIPTIVSWQASDIMNFYDEVYNLDLISSDGEFTPESIIDDMPVWRPERQNVSRMYAFIGYLNGEYFLNDLTPNLLASSHSVILSKTYTDYMTMAWTPILLENKGTVDGKSITIPEDLFFPNIDGWQTNQVKNEVKQTSYDLNEINYSVSIAEPLVMIENEIYYPGWTAELRSSDLMQSITAIEVNDIFRGWILPQGTYQMEASFEFPKINLYYSISIISVIIWLTLTMWVTFHKVEIKS